MMKFARATRKKAKLRLALTGPSGSGKTLSALLLAQGLGGSIAVIDTERDSASMYAGDITLPDGRTIRPPAFDTLSLGAPYTPERYIEAIRAAEDGGYATLVIDSLTHEWSGVGGCLEMVDAIASAKYRGNTWSAWSEVTPRHRALIDAMMQSPMHVIATLRSKTETAQQDVGGKKTVVKLGTRPEQREGIEYEMSIVLDLTHDGHFATASKDRTGLLMGRDPFVVTPDTGRMLLEWLESGEGAAPSQMTQTAMADHLAAIDAASTMDELRAVYETAYRAARDAGDRQAMEDVGRAKDARKAALTKVTVEV